MLVLEREASLRLEGSAIAMWTNAFRALDALGVGPQLRQSHPLLERWPIPTSLWLLLLGKSLADQTDKKRSASWVPAASVDTAICIRVHVIHIVYMLSCSCVNHQMKICGRESHLLQLLEFD